MARSPEKAGDSAVEQAIADAFRREERLRTLPGPEERIAELTRVLTQTADSLHQHHRYWISVGNLSRSECGAATCRDATAALAGDYVRDGGR